MSFLSPSLRLENLSTKPIMSLDHLTDEKRYNKNNIVAKWCAPIKGKMYRIELEHGTTSGRRMIWVNGKVSLYFPLIKKSQDFSKIHSANEIKCRFGRRLSFTGNMVLTKR